MSFCILLNTKADILKNVGNQTVDDSHCLPRYFPIQWKSMATVRELEGEQMMTEFSIIMNYPFKDFKKKSLYFLFIPLHQEYPHFFCVGIYFSNEKLTEILPSEK